MVTSNTFFLGIIIDNTPCKKMPIVGNILLVKPIQANFLLLELSLGNLVLFLHLDAHFPDFLLS